MPKFSLIIGVYNHVKTLPGLIDSLNNQSFQDFEVHFCDDGSDDGSSELIEAFIEQVGLTNARYFHHRQDHKGMRLAKNVNQGIKVANGQYCVFVMGDSLLNQDYLEVLSWWVTPDRMVCGIRVQIDTIEGKIEGVDIDWRLKKNLIPQFPTIIISQPWRCFTGNGLCIPTKAFELYGPWMDSIEGYGGEDNEIVARLFYRGYMPWSVPDLKLFHHWHKSQEGVQGNQSFVANKIKDYYLHGV